MPFKNMSRQNESSSAPQIINSKEDRNSSVNALVRRILKEYSYGHTFKNYAAKLWIIQGVTWLHARELYIQKLYE